MKDLINVVEFTGEPILPNFFRFSLKNKIVCWWHRTKLERWLILTTKILKDAELLDTLFTKFLREKKPSGNAGELFIDHIQEQPLHPTIKAVANMELALLRLKDPMHHFRYRIEFNQHPFILFDALLGKKPYSLESDGERYELVVCNSVPGKMIVYPLT